jgi:hypothetical protein
MFVGYGLGIVGFNFGNQSDVEVFHFLNHPVKKDETIIGFVLSFIPILQSSVLSPEGSSRLYP